MKKFRFLCLLLSLAALLHCTPMYISATESGDSVVPPQQEVTEPFEEPPAVEYGGVPITNGCRTINGMTPLGGSDRILKTAQAAFIYEVTTETVIYSYNPDIHLYPGSLAKIGRAHV